MEQSIIPSLAAIRRPRKRGSSKEDESLPPRPPEVEPRVHWLQYGGVMGTPALTSCLRRVDDVLADQRPDMVTCWKCLERIEAAANSPEPPLEGRRARATARPRKQRSQSRASTPARVEHAVPVASGR